MLNAWVEWKQQCAADACSVETQKQLRTYARSRFDRFVRFYSSETEPPSHDDPWHLLETRLALTNNSKGKRYKDWLFARVETSDDDPLDVVQGGASLMMKTVVREYLRAEAPGRDTVSLSQPMRKGGETTLTWLDILPAGLDPASEASLREYEELAARHVPDFLADMSKREQVVVFSKHAGVSLAHPRVERLAGGKKSVLNTAYREFLARVAGKLAAQYEQDDPESILTLALMTVQKLSEEIFLKKKSENTFASLFMLVKGRSRDTAKA